jgi:hypothetical protein
MFGCNISRNHGWLQYFLQAYNAINIQKNNNTHHTDCQFKTVRKNNSTNHADCQLKTMKPSPSASMSVHYTQQLFSHAR